MANFKIYFQYDDEFLWEMKGYRSDVYVKTNDKFYKLFIYSVFRLNQDFEDEMNANGYYFVDPNLILVNNVCKKEIIYTIGKLYSGKYFDQIKPIDDIPDKLIEIYCE